MSPAPFGRDCCSGSTVIPNCSDQASFSGKSVGNSPSPPVREVLPLLPPLEDCAPACDACGSEGVVLFVAPLDESCPGGVGLTDLGSANELALATRLNTRAAQQTMMGFPGKSIMISPIC